MKTITGIFTNKNTIRKNLLSYFFRSAIFFLLLTALNILFYTVTLMQYEQEHRQLLRLNDFYAQLKETNSTLYVYSSSNDPESYQILSKGKNDLSAILSEICELSIGPEFSRDILDISQVFQNYCQQFETIHFLFQQPEASESISAEYEEAQKLFEIINSEFQNLYSQILMAYKTSMEQMQQRENLYIIFLILALILILVYETYQAKYLADRISRPILALAESASRIKQQGIEHASQIAMVDSINEETTLLVHMFNSMLSKIQHQISDLENYMNTKIQLKQQALENLKISEQLKSSQLKMLQMQINPHFLFNTLNMISQTAYTENAYQTIFLLGKTASLLRYSLDFSNKSVTLKRELEELENYVYIQEQRFGSRIQFLFDLEEKCHDILIPNLILQPLVENAIIHGVSMYLKDAVIKIVTSIDEPSGTVHISVIDNGVGISKEQIDVVHEEMIHPKTPDAKIGLSNVYYRLQYFFDHRADLVISSVPHHSTEFMMILPLPNIRSL